ncbi:hypothetical protein K0M31_005543 [Melipona bicolor]|uniref:Uncharacterized protein n=1 Tax=Melipona bicolor TaxID=60889 RepID=A0AA40FVU2_9HYME|nr:hypothetical protein K0M31_005543 [Melipona bicolor]
MTESRGKVSLREQTTSIRAHQDTRVTESSHSSAFMEGQRDEMELCTPFHGDPPVARQTRWIRRNPDIVWQDFFLFDRLSKAFNRFAPGPGRNRLQHRELDA